MSSSPLTSARIEMSSSTWVGRRAGTRGVSPAIDRRQGSQQALTAFPNVALSRPPSVSPTRSASCSVANPRSDASGMMASAEKTKTIVSAWWVNSIAHATGIMMSRTLSQLAEMTFQPARFQVLRAGGARRRRVSGGRAKGGGARRRGGADRSASLASFLVGFMSVSTIGRRPPGVAVPSALRSTSCRKNGVVVPAPEVTVPGAGWNELGLGAVGARLMSLGGASWDDDRRDASSMGDVRAAMAPTMGREESMGSDESDGGTMWGSAHVRTGSIAAKERLRPSARNERRGTHPCRLRARRRTRAAPSG